MENCVRFRPLKMLIDYLIDGIMRFVPGSGKHRRSIITI